MAEHGLSYFKTKGCMLKYKYPHKQPCLQRYLILEGTSGVSAKGLEPLTNGLKGHCSAIELRAR
jgi:hypothetical protein